MFTNQYIVAHESTEPKDGFADAVTVKFADLRIYAHARLNVTVVSGTSSQIALLGHIIDPLNPGDTNEAIVERLATRCGSFERLLGETQGFTGRYVLLFRTADSFIVSGDACHLRQIYFGFPDDKVAITSSPKLFLSYFGYDPQIDSRKKRVTEMQLYARREQSWYGDESIDDRLAKLLPNHCLDLLDRETRRITFFPTGASRSGDQVIPSAALLLKNTFTALAKRYRLIAPLTAGWDSRVLLAASRGVKDDIRFYVFDRSSGTSDDGRIPRALSEALGLRFEAVEPLPLTESFLSVYRREHVLPRVLPKTEHIQHHYLCGYDGDVVNVNGNAAEVARCFYGYAKRTVTLDMLCAFSGYGTRIPYFREQLARWYGSAAEFSSQYGIGMLDLFYWEQRMGNWGALYPFEQDMAVEEIAPFNNRSLLLSLLSIDAHERRAPAYRLFRKLAEDLWPEVLSEPVNPSEGVLKGLYKGNATIRYLRTKARRD